MFFSDISSNIIFLAEKANFETGTLKLKLRKREVWYFYLNIAKSVGHLMYILNPYRNKNLHIASKQTLIATVH